MTNEQLVEKVAAAIYESHPAYQGTARVHRIEWDQARHGISGAECYRQARAAIAAIYEAMREPTPDQLTTVGTMAGWNEAAHRGADDCHVAWWQAMLDASPLKGEQRNDP